MAWQLRVLGEVSLEREGRRLAPERKTAALLAFLALEGAASRSRLAGLLWPDSPEERARGNLRQLLRRLKGAADASLLETGDPLRLSPEVTIDAVELQASALSRHDGTSLPSHPGELLGSHDYDDCPELQEWLGVQRQRFVAFRRELLEEEAAKLEGERQHAAALRSAERLLELDPLSEESHRRIMRLHYLLGDRAAALRAYQRCRETLRRELGLEPLPETEALAQQIERQAPSLPPRNARQELPLSLVRPPRLVGRASAMRRLESAWLEGRAVFISGEPGMGKSRLMHDFAAGKGRMLRLAARPGDGAVPYAMFSRGWRELLTAPAELSLPAWAISELARLLPELAEGTIIPPAVEADKARLLEANAEAVRSAVASGRRTVAVDDLQYADAASLEALAYLIGSLSATEVAPRWLIAFRQGELDPEAEEVVREFLSSGVATSVELAPLAEDEVETFFEGLGLEGTQGLARPLSRYTGGNPLFLVETLKSLAETGQLGKPFPERMPPPGQLGAIVGQRLDRLSPAALRLARAVAILGDAFELEGAAALLTVDPLELSGPLQELERAQLLGPDGFSHDVIQQVVEGSIPVAAHRLLHRRAARYLEGIPVPPGLVARHHLAAGDEALAAPFLREAGDSAMTAYRVADAADFYERAAELFERHGHSDDAFDSLSLLVESLLKHEYGPRHDQVEERLFRLARSPRQFAQAWQTRCIFRQLLAKAEESEAAAREGYRHALKAGNISLQVELLNNLVGALWLQDRVAETLPILEEAIALAENDGNAHRLSECLSNMGVMLDYMNRHREAIECHDRAVRLRFEHAGRLSQLQVLGNLGVSQAELGLARDSLATAERMLELLDEVHGVNDLRMHALIGAGSARRDLSDFSGALPALERAVELAEGLRTWIVAPARRHLAMTYAVLGHFERAREQLERALAQEEMPAQFRGEILRVLAVTVHACGGDPLALLSRAEELIGPGGRPLRRGNLLLAKALALPPHEALAAAEQALQLSRSLELGGLGVAAETRCAQALLALGRPGEALAHASRASELLRTYNTIDFYVGEVMYTRVQAMAANGAPEAAGELRHCLAWLEDVAVKRTPEEYREGFLNRNPANRALLAEARAAGISFVLAS